MGHSSKAAMERTGRLWILPRHTIAKGAFVRQARWNGRMGNATRGRVCARTLERGQVVMCGTCTLYSACTSAQKTVPHRRASSVATLAFRRRSGTGEGGGCGLNSPCPSLSHCICHVTARACVLRLLAPKHPAPIAHVPRHCLVRTFCACSLPSPPQNLRSCHVTPVTPQPRHATAVVLQG
jgi:hypothetical protein